MSRSTVDPLEYYAEHSIMTDPCEHGDMLADLPRDVPDLMRVVQGVLIHPFCVEVYRVPETQWAAFECQGQIPESIVQTEMYAFMEWLPGSGYEHALAPEMEVYLAGDACEFWLPIVAVDAELR